MPSKQNDYRGARKRRLKTAAEFTAGRSDELTVGMYLESAIEGVVFDGDLAVKSYVVPSRFIVPSKHFGQALL
jgi:hypothetical protein